MAACLRGTNPPELAISSWRVRVLAACALLLGFAASSDAQCVVNPGETFVSAAHRCVGWLQHPQDARRAKFAAPDPRLLSLAGDRDVKQLNDSRAELFGADQVVDELFSLIVEIVVDRARRQGLAIVHDKVENGICDFPIPPAVSVQKPLLPDTCALIQSTDLLSLVGQARALRTAFTSDVLRVGEAEMVTHFDLPPFRQATTATFVLLRRYATEAELRPTATDVRPIVEAFINAAWATTTDGTTFTPIVTVTREVATLEVALSAARVYIRAAQLRDAAGSKDVIDIARVIGLQQDLCNIVFPPPAAPLVAGQPAPPAPVLPPICPNVPTQALDWTNLAIRAAAALASKDADNFKPSLRALAQLSFDTLYEVQQTRLKPVGTADQDWAFKLAAIRWTRTIAQSAIDDDLPRLISALAELARDSVLERCDGDCVNRRKVAALLSGIAAYSSTYVRIPEGATDAQKIEFAKAQQTARKEALQSVIDAATDRRGRGGDHVWSIATGVGVVLDSHQRLEGIPVALTKDVQLHVPLGVAWQRLPKGNWFKNGPPLHLMANFLDLGNYINKDRSTSEGPDWQAILAPGLQLGLPLSVSSSNFFVGGISASYAPRFKSEEAKEVKGAWHYGFFVNFFLPLWDLN